MKASTILALCLIAFGAVNAWPPASPAPAPGPAPDPIPAPDAATQRVVATITEKLAGHPGEAAELAAFYAAAAETLRRDAAGENVIATTAELRTFCQRAVTIRFQGTFSKIPGLADQIHGPAGALAKLIGLEAGELDHAKAAAAFDAVAWACREATG